MAIEEGMREVLATIAGSPVVASRLLSDARSVMEGHTPARALFDTASAQEDSDETPSDDTTDDQENDRETGAAPIPDTLSRYLQAIIELCQRRQVDRAALAARLFDVGLSAEYREVLQRMAEQDRTHAKTPRSGSGRDSAKAKQGEAALRGGQPQAGDLVREKTWRPAPRGQNTGRKHRSHARRRQVRLQTGSEIFHLCSLVDQTSRITRTVADTARIIRLPVHVTDSLRKVERARVLEYARDGRDSDVDRIAALTDLPPDRVRKMLAVPEDPLPMDDPGIMEEVSNIADEGTPSPEKMAIGWADAEFG